MKLSNPKVAAVTVLLFLALPVAHASDWSGSIGAVLGNKSMNDKDWPQHDEQGSIGVLFDIKKESWPVSIAFDVFASGDEDRHRSVKYQAHTVETHLGIRKIFKRSGSSIKPYLGGGVAFVWAEEKNNDSGTTRSQDDSSNGAWVGGGMYVEMAPDFSLGLDIRYSGAEVSLFDADREAGGLSTGISAVYNW